MTSDQKQIIVDTGAKVSTISEECANQLTLNIYEKLIQPKEHKVVKKSCHSRLENKLKRLEDRFDILDNDLIELKWEMDDIKKNLSKSKPKTKHITSSDSSGSD